MSRLLHYRCEEIYFKVCFDDAQRCMAVNGWQLNKGFYAGLPSSTQKPLPALFALNALIQWLLRWSGHRIHRVHRGRQKSQR